MAQFNWEKMRPSDGHFAALNISGEVSAELHFGLYVSGKLVHSRIIASHRFPTARHIGNLKRQLIFWEGLAEFLNAGGVIHDIYGLFSVVAADCNPLYFADWSYFNTGISDEGNRVHEFISDRQEDVNPMRFVRWVRGEFIDFDITEHDMQDTDNHGLNDVPTETEDLREIGFISEG